MRLGGFGGPAARSSRRPSCARELVSSVLLVSESGAEHGRLLSQGPCHGPSRYTREPLGVRAASDVACYDLVAAKRFLYRIQVTISAHAVQRAASPKSSSKARLRNARYVRRYGLGNGGNGRAPPRRPRRWLPTTHSRPPPPC